MSKIKVIEVFEGTQMIMQIGTDTKDRVETVTFGVDELEELNADYINEHYGSLQDEAYKRGLDDAWECMKKIAFLEKPRDMRDFFGHTTFGGILTGYTATEAIEKLKAYEGYSRDKDLCGGCVWEDRFDGDCSMCSNNYRWLYRAKETTNDIKVGDEVINNTTGTKGILLEPETQHLLATVIDPNNRWNTFNIRHRNLTKTGKHFDIEKLLEAVKE